MKITKQQLKQLIKEEIESLFEAPEDPKEQILEWLLELDNMVQSDAPPPDQMREKIAQIKNLLTQPSSIDPEDRLAYMHDFVSRSDGGPETPNPFRRNK